MGEKLDLNSRGFVNSISDPDVRFAGINYHH